ncbi:orotate phosphoribosyltransferase [Candidatus Providencia siddallii]|uniref:Orotate phosphoribosyltransferase n=1 Tax=Candidatus Providencia siddallii TaxID=1715285 RepID=A0ABM9NNC3_9GAMM
MKKYKVEFIELALKRKAIKFGDFILKSGRKSPFFFNFGSFNTGYDLSLVGRYYAEALKDNEIDCDVVLGIAYKGIPIVVSMVIALSEYYNINMSYSFNRKEFKKYGEKGSLIGSSLKGRVLIVDDVITSGASIYESIKFIEQKKAIISGVLLCLDRQEVGKNKMLATKEIERKYCNVYSIITINDLINYLSNFSCMKDHLFSLRVYHDRYKENIK